MSASKDMQPMSHFGRIFWQNQFRTKIEVPDHVPSMVGKVAVVTGANSGLGLEVAKQLLGLGVSRLVLAVRSVAKGQTAASILKGYNDKATLDVWQLDMESYTSIQNFVRRCDKELVRMDYTILNAGLSPTSFHKSESTGHEVTIQVNHLGTALLAILLLPVLKSKAHGERPARLTIVNSLTAHLCKFPNRNARPLLPSFDNTAQVPWSAQERYGVSKLLNQLFLVKLSEMVPPDTIILNMVDPGLTKGTQLSRDASGLLRLAANSFFAICGRPLIQGAATYIHALEGTGKESHGCFLMSNKVSPLAGIYYTPEGDAISQQIWDETLDELRFAHVQDIFSSTF